MNGRYSWRQRFAFFSSVRPCAPSLWGTAPRFCIVAFDFALCVREKNAEVLASFYPHPPEDWLDAGGRTVTFYPFLIVTKREGRDQAVWLPYWHVIRDGEKENLKYGQWTPFMDMELFKDLLAQARNAGFLNHEA